MWRVPAISTALLSCLILGCDHPVDEELHLNFVGLAPLEVDTVPDDTDGDGDVEGYIAEEVTVELRLDPHPNINAFQQRQIDITSYSIEYTVLPPTGGTIPGYFNGTAMHLAAGEQGEFPIRAVSFKQKTHVRETFGAGADVNVTANLTLSGTTDDGEAFEEIGAFDIIFANFVEPE